MLVLSSGIHQAFQKLQFDLKLSIGFLTCLFLRSCRSKSCPSRNKWKLQNQLIPWSQRKAGRNTKSDPICKPGHEEQRAQTSSWIISGCGLWIFGGRRGHTKQHFHLVFSCRWNAICFQTSIKQWASLRISNQSGVCKRGKIMIWFFFWSFWVENRELPFALICTGWRLL